MKLECLWSPEGLLGYYLEVELGVGPPIRIYDRENMLDWLIEEHPGDRFVLELLERIFCLLWKESKERGNT